MSSKCQFGTDKLFVFDNTGIVQNINTKIAAYCTNYKIIFINFFKPKFLQKFV